MTGPVESRLRVACVQMNPVIGETQRNVARTHEFIAQAATQNTCFRAIG